MIRAKLSYLRISPRKVRLVTDLIKGLTAEEAERQLRFLTKRAAQPLLKLLKSALANAQNSANLTKENLYLSKIIVESGPVLKRWRARAMGRAAPIAKRTSHITLILDEKETGTSKPKKEAKAKLLKAKTGEGLQEKTAPELTDQSRPVEEEPKAVAKPRPIPPARPYPTTSQSKRRFFSRQTFGNVKKYFRRKSI